MSTKITRSDVALDVGLDVAPASQRTRRAEPDAPFRILVLGDFSGRKSRGVEKGLAGRRPVLIDRDNLDEVMSAMHVSLRVAGADISFSELDDFHPDALYKRLPMFRSAPPNSDPGPVQARPVPSTAGLLDAILADEPETVTRRPASDDVAEIIRRAMVGQTVIHADPAEARREAQVEAFHADLMRALLRHPAFQALEAGWRGLDMLVRGLDTDGALKLFLFDATLDELAADPAGLQSLLAGQAEPWAVVAANFSFGRSAKDAARLRQFALLAQAGGAPFLAESEPPSDEADPSWDALRRAPEAAWVGLAMPRFLLRLPYGNDTSPIERFAFEEMPQSDHTSYLWGNPALACAFLLGQAFLDQGWDMNPNSHKELRPLPQHVYQENGEFETKPCAEMWMTDGLAEALMAEGIMPLASVRNEDAALLVRFQSIAEPLARLAGRW